jgi:hypothetical protein
MTIHAGDSLLFTAGVGATGTLHIAVMDGSNQVCQTREVADQGDVKIVCKYNP